MKGFLVLFLQLFLLRLCVLFCLCLLHSFKWFALSLSFSLFFFRFGVFAQSEGYFVCKIGKISTIRCPLVRLSVWFHSFAFEWNRKNSQAFRFRGRRRARNRTGFGAGPSFSLRSFRWTCSLSLFERKLLICSTVCVVCFYHFGWAPDTFFFHVNTSVLVKDLAFFNHLLCV